MTGRDCARTRAELEEYLHNELRAQDAEDIRQHMADCLECTGEFTVGVVLTEVVRRACVEVAPAELRVEVLTRIRTIQREHLRG